MANKKLILENIELLNTTNEVCFRYNETACTVEFLEINKAIYNSGANISLDYSVVDNFFKNYYHLCSNKNIYIEKSSLEKEANDYFFNKYQAELSQINLINIDNKQLPNFTGTIKDVNFGSNEDKKAIILAKSENATHFTSAFHEFTLASIKKVPCYFILTKEQKEVFKMGEIPERINKLPNTIIN